MYASLSVYLTWNLLSFLDVQISVFIIFENFSVIMSFNIVTLFFISSFGMSTMHISIHLRVSQSFLKLISIFFILFSFCCSDWIISTDLFSRWLIIYSVHSKNLLITYSIFKTFKKSFRFTGKLSEIYRYFSCPSCPYTCIDSPIIKSLTRVVHLFSSNEPILTDHYHPKSRVYLNVHSCCWTLYEFWQMYNDVYPSF